MSDEWCHLVAVHVLYLGAVHLQFNHRVTNISIIIISSNSSSISTAVTCCIVDPWTKTLYKATELN